MKKLILMALLILLTHTNATFGFATIFAPKGGDIISFNSNVSGMDVYLNGQKIAEDQGSNFVHQLQRDGMMKKFEFTKEGYDSATVIVTTKTAPEFFINFAIGGVFGSSTDSIFTKNYKEYSPNRYFVQLRKR